MANGISSEMKARAAAMFVSFCDVLKKDVLDSDGLCLGRIYDISAKSGEVYPKLDELIALKGPFYGRFYASIPWSKVINMDDDLIVDLKRQDLKYGPEPNEYDFLLRRDILDQQVVDTYNHKVRRVNDIHLLKVDHELMIAHVDTGLRGLLRRLGWEKVIDLLVRSANRDSPYLKKEELISWKYVQPVSINPASMTMKLSVSEKQLLGIPAADLGDIIFDLDVKQRIALFRSLDVKTKARVFENLNFDEQNDILKELDKKEAALIVTHMSSDEATDLLEKLPHNTVENLLTLIETSRAKKLSTLLGYSSDSAGGIMTTECVSLLETISAEAAIEYIKKQTKQFETVPYIYIVDERNHLKGVTTIRRLLFAEPKDAIITTAFNKTLYMYLNNSVKEVAYFMDKYRLSAIPVIDEKKVLQGIITMDDILSQVISIAWRKRARRPPAPKRI